MPTAAKSTRAIVKSAAKGMTPKVRALLALGLDRDFVPPTQYGLLLARVPGGQKGVLRAVAGTCDPKLAPVMARYNSLTAKEREAVSIDVLIAGAVASGIEIDPPDILGAVVAELTRTNTALTSMVAAMAAPNTMKAVARAAQSTLDGHNDRKLLLQTVGVAPVPKTSVTNITAGRIDARQQQNNVLVQNAPRLEDITRVVSSAKVIPELVDSVMGRVHGEYMTEADREDRDARDRDRDVEDGEVEAP